MGRPNGQTSHSRRVRVHWGGCQTPAGRRKASRENKATRKKNPATHRPGSRTSEAKQVEAKPAEAHATCSWAVFLESLATPSLRLCHPASAWNACSRFVRDRSQVLGKGQTGFGPEAALTPCSPSFAHDSPSHLCTLGSATSDLAAATLPAGCIIELLRSSPLSSMRIYLLNYTTALSRCLKCWPSPCSLMTACWQHRLTCGKAQESG